MNLWLDLGSLDSRPEEESNLTQEEQQDSAYKEQKGLINIISKNKEKAKLFWEKLNYEQKCSMLN